jgi:hypothetical protein
MSVQLPFNETQTFAAFFGKHLIWDSAPDKKPRGNERSKRTRDLGGSFRALGVSA